MSPRPLVGVMALARATFDVAHAEQTTSQAFATLDALDAEIVGPRSLLFDEDAARRALVDLKQKRLDLMLILQVTFTDAGVTRRIAEEIEAPLAFWAFPEPRTGGRLRLNSLCGVNLAALHLRPIGGKPWEYYFFIDLEGHRADPNVAAALAEAASVAHSHRVLGSFPRAVAAGSARSTGGG